MITNNGVLLPKDHIPQIKEYYIKRITQLQSEIDEINELLKSLDVQFKSSSPNFSPVVNQIGQGVLIPTQPQLTNGYHPRWSLVKKAKFAIKQAGRPLTSKEIVDLIIANFEPDVQLERKKFMSSMSGVLSANSTKPNPIFKRHQNELEEWEYDVA